MLSALVGRSLREWTGKLALVAASTLVTVVLAEVAIRIVLPPHNLVQRREADLVGLLKADSLADFRYTAGFEGLHRSEDFEVRVLTDGRGFRVPPGYQESDEGLHLLAIGNSLTFGWGVEAEEAWPFALESALEAKGLGPVTTADAGVASYNVKQMNALLREVLDDVEPDVVVIGVYASGLVRLDNPFRLFSGSIIRTNELARVRPHPEGYWRSPLASARGAALDLWLSQHFTIGALSLEALAALKASLQPGEDAPPVSEETPPLQQSNGLPNRAARMLLETLGWLEERGVEGVVMILVTQQEDGAIGPAPLRWSAALEEGLRAGGEQHIVSTVPFVAPGLNRFEHDQHWLPPTHARVGAALADSLVTWGLVGPATGIQ